MGSKAKQVAGVAAAPMTGGASLALTAKEMHDEKKEKEEKSRRRAAEAQEREAELAQENKRLSKELDISQRQQKRTGLGSLVGGGDTLG